MYREFELLRVSGCFTLISVRPIGRTGQERRAPAAGDARDVIAGASTPTAVNGSDSGGTPMR